MGQAVGEGFVFPWNVTRSLADVWADERREAARIRASRMNKLNRERFEKSLEDRRVYVSSNGKLAFAGYDSAERL
jgi:hypothetical protein